MPQPTLTGPASASEINTFLATYAPSAGSKAHGRFFVAKKEADVEVPAMEEQYRSKFNAFKSEVWPYEMEMTDACTLIADTAPVRGNKSMGVKSQKQLREVEHAKFHHHLKTIAAKHEIKTGAWLAFLNPDEVDNAWTRVVHELTGKNGSLAAAGATYAKCSSTEISDRMPHSLWLWVKDATDPVSVETVFRIAVEQCGFVPTSFKTDAMDRSPSLLPAPFPDPSSVRQSIVGIGSKHSSKITVSLYGKTAFTTTKEAKQAVEDYQKRGPAAHISPLSGPPPLPEIDWDAAEYAPADDQPRLDENGAGPAPSATTSTPKAKKPVKALKSTSRKRKAAPVDDSDSDDDAVKYDEDVSELYAPRRTPRKAAQKAYEVIHAAAVGSSGSSRVSHNEQEELFRSPSPTPEPSGRGGVKQEADEDAWKPEPEDFAGGRGKRLRLG
ncbi:hypothetical protein JCM10213v2_005605 [Rhodosporidiobolus nylandii]